MQDGVDTPTSVYEGTTRSKGICSWWTRPSGRVRGEEVFGTAVPQAYSLKNSSS